MSKNSDNNITDWKRLWQLVSGIHYETPVDTVRDKLLDISKELQDGIQHFKSSKSSNIDLEKLLKEKKQEKLYPFTKKLQEILDLESKQCWDILCFYLANEFRGSVNSLTAFISTEGNMSKLLDDIWGYYSLERMIVLKIMKNLLYFYEIPAHPYHDEYKLILDKITLKKLRQSYLQQLEHLINENPSNNIISGELINYQSKLTAWSERNAREINEILHILILIVNYIGIEASQLKTLFNSFKSHGFGKQQRYLDVNNDFHKQLMTKMSYSEIVLFVKCIDVADKEVDSAWITDVLQSLDKDISLMYHNPENGPLLLSWMLLNFRAAGATEDDVSLHKYRQFGVRAVHLNVFGFLKELISHQMFNDDSLLSKVARKTIYNQMTYLCDLFDADGSVGHHPFVYDLLSKLLEWPAIAKEFCNNDDSGVWSLFNTALETFPTNLVHLSMIATSLSKAGKHEYIQEHLENLPIYSELYDASKHSLQPDDEDYILTASYRPFTQIDYTIPAGTAVVVVNKPNECFVHFRTSVNYFHVLQNEINLLLTEAMQYPELDQNRLNRVNSGISYLKTALKKLKSPSDISAEMVHPTEMCIDLLNKFKNVQCPPIVLLANCLDVCSSLLPLFESQIITRVINLNILPFMSSESLDYKKYALGVCFDSSLVGTYLVDVERKLEKYDFLLAYLKFLRTHAKLGKNRLFQMEIPGLIFLLREVFPHALSWHFQTQKEKNMIYAEMMGFICDVLDNISSLGNGSTDEKLLRNICVYSLLNLENGIVLLRFVALGNAYLQLSMEMECNWMELSTHDVMLLVRSSMRILMQLLRLKTTIFESSTLSPLEALIYTQPKQRDTLRIIPVVTGYMSNIFDRWLPILSCRLLKRIALEFNMSLLACLDMEPDQIRLTFLQRLPDDLESDDLKIAVLELVEACIHKQPGMTEAFFKVNFEKEKRLFVKEKQSNIGDSIITFMEDYLEAVAKMPNIVENPLSSRIMSLFHALWKNSMQGLVEELTKKPTFWPSLCHPIFGPLNKNVKAYSQLFNVLGIEVFCTTNKTNDDLKKTLQKFLSSESFDKWVDHVFDLPKLSQEDYLTDETHEWLSQLQSFKDFIVILLKKNPKGLEMPDQKKKMFAEKCLTVLVDRAGYTDDLRPFIILSEMYLLVLLSFKRSYTDNEAEDKIMLNLLIKLLSNVENCYGDLHIRAKESCLSIAIKAISLLADELTKDLTVALSFLYSAVGIICCELSNLENSVKAEIKSSTSTEYLHTNSLVLCLNLLKTIAVVFQNDGPNNWDMPFIANKVFNRLLSCTGWILQLYSKQKLSVELLDVLIVFAKGNCSNEFIYCDVGDYLWLKLLPPRELLQASYALQQPKQSEWSVEKWWPIYHRGIELVSLLFEKHGYQFLKEVLSFVGIHEEYLMDSLMLAKQSLEPNAVVLVKNTVHLIAKLVPFEKVWRLEHSHSLFNLMRCVQMLMGHAISLFNQQKNLKMLVSGKRSQLDIIRDSTTGDLADDILTALNDLTEIITVCAKCLLRFSPTLLDLLCEPEFLASKWEPLFEIQFGPPKLNDSSMQLTFGIVLSVVGIFTKALNLQHYGFQEVPLNILPSNQDKNATPETTTKPLNTTSQLTTTTASTSRRCVSKSISMASISSTTAPPNEMLSNLDGELCLMALENILTLAASQSLLALKNSNLTNREKQIIRREISTELMTYHDFVRKKVLIDFREHKEIWHRRKHGIVMMNPAGAESYGSGATAKRKSSSPDANRRLVDHKTSMRVNVVRRLHLQQQHRTPGSDRDFDMTQVISPIAGTSSNSGESGQHTVASTPNLARPSIRQMVNDGPDSAKIPSIEEEIEYFSPEEPTHTTLSYVQIVEEDYLHLMSNLFTVICQSD